MSAKHYDYYELTPSKRPEEGIRESVQNSFFESLGHVGFFSIREQMEQSLEKIIRPLFGMLQLEDRTESFSHEACDDAFGRTNAYFGMSEDNEIVMAIGPSLPRRLRTREKTAIASNILVVHVRSDGKKTLKERCVDLLKTADLTMNTEDKSSLCSSIEDRISKLSSTGKLLSQEETRKKALALLDENTSSILSMIQALGGVADPHEMRVIRKEMKMKKKELDELVGSLKKRGLVANLLQISCSRCGFPGFRTDASADIGQLLSQIRCGSCNSALKRKDVNEVLVLPKDVEILLNGVWLEEYVRNIVQEKLAKVWQGRFLGNDELDVVGLRLGEVFLFECKTTTIGHTDVYNLFIKARRLRASVIFLITTAEIVENAKKTVEEMRRSEGLRIHMVEGSTDEIRNGIEEVLEREILQRLRAFSFRCLGSSRYYRSSIL